MADIVTKIGYAMSLRNPQQEALSYLDAISTHCDYKKDSKTAIEAVATEYCEKQRKIQVDDKFDFPSFCYAMATGIGKTRLMGACMYYLYKTKGYRHFFILAPGNTIYEKLRKESNPNHPKYIFKGLEAEMGRPKVYDGENYDSYPVRYEQMSLQFEKSSEIELFIFNIGKIFNSKTDSQFNFHKFKETLGMSFAEVLSSFDDLVICMDEAHRYYAPASMKAINFLKPVLADLVDVLIEKSQNGIYVKFFVNNIENQKGFEKLCRYKGRFLHIYNFAGSKDSMAALHAKVISVDEQQTLITSANLSYHGQEGNIELGTLVDSKKIARQVDDVFTHLIFNKIVQEI